jgi:2-polyprenyl-6-methoxyphenol hydroxylase-like FAD-dependent oxidoreductase
VIDRAVMVTATHVICANCGDSRSVLVRGGGAVGLSAALALARQGLRVALHAPGAPAAASADVRAYALNAASRQCLDAVRGWPEADGTVTPVTRMEVCGDKGGQLSFEATDVQQPSMNWIVDVPALEARLPDAVGLSPGRHCRAGGGGDLGGA